MPPSSSLRALVVTNMFPSAERPAFGRFVADQVTALRGFDGVEVEVAVLTGGSPTAYARAALGLRRRFARRRFDVVHAHFGLSAAPSLAVPAAVHAVTLHGTDLAHPRSRAITLATLPLLDVVGVASAELGSRVPLWAARNGVTALPCGIDLRRFRPLSRPEARAALGLDPEVRYVLFPADPSRPEKRVDLARAAVEATVGSLPPADRPEVRLLTLGDVAPERVPGFVNAADAVIIPSDREGFGLACLEALACDVPVAATPHGIAPAAVGAVAGCCCAPFDAGRWGAWLAGVLARQDPRVSGRSVAATYSAEALAGRVLEVWRGLLVGAGVPARK